MRACLALSILSDTRTAASTDSARSLKSTFETGHSALSGSAVAEPIVHAAADQHEERRSRGHRHEVAGPRGAGGLGGGHARPHGGDGRLEVDQLGDRLVHDVGAPGGQQRDDLVVGVERTPAARYAETRAERVDQLVVGLDRDEVDRLVQRGAVDEGAVAVTVVVVRHSDHLLLWHRLA